jgi:ATP-dependent 26S proteasome regulatory subunit
MSHNENTEGKFKIKKITRFNELTENQILELPESDLCFQNEDCIIQMKYERPEEDKKYEIKPGIYTLAESSTGIVTQKVELKERKLLESVDNTKQILKEAKTFFSKLHVYERLGRPKKRGVLLYSKPGMGKTSAIEKFCGDAVKEDDGTVVLIWPTSDIEADSLVRFLTSRSEYTAECTRLILIIEDIGGGERDGEGGRSGVDSGLLNLLDGIGVTFKLPTFIVATTNHPENLLESLADRPGRFDLMLELNPPDTDERILLLQFISRRELTPEEIEAIKGKGTDKFSIAHLEEIPVRAELHDKTYVQVIKELVEHSERFKKAFDKKGSLGLGLFQEE